MRSAAAHGSAQGGHGHNGDQRHAAHTGRQADLGRRSGMQAVRQAGRQAGDSLPLRVRDGGMEKGRMLSGCNLPTREYLVGIYFSHSPLSQVSADCC